MNKKGMKTPLMIFGLVVALGAGYVAGKSSGGHADHSPASSEGPAGGKSASAKTQYTCGMHPFIVQDEPGTCPICGMNLTPLKGGASAGQGEHKVTLWKSPMDPTYVRNEPGKDPMGHDLVPVVEDGGAGVISIDPVTIQNMGVRLAAATREEISREIRAVGRIGYEESKQYVVNSKIGGWIERLHVNQTGQVVRKGQPLMEIYSPELVAAQEEYLLALRNRSDLARSEFADIAAGGDRLLKAARQRLNYWDITPGQVERLERSGQVRKTMTLFAPYSGVVTEKKAFQGMSIEPGMELMQLADISQVWVYADIYEYELPLVKKGQQAQVEIPFGLNKTLRGKIDYIYPFVDPKSRTVQVRIVLPNPGLELKPEMFANVRLQSESARDAVTVPSDAVLNSGTGQHVFVALGEGKFEPRPVKTGLQGESGRVQILSGLKEGEEVVTSAQFMLDSESKLREALQKMMAPKGSASPPAAAPGHKGDGLPGGQKENLDDLF